MTIKVLKQPIFDLVTIELNKTQDVPRFKQFVIDHVSSCSWSTCSLFTNCIMCELYNAFDESDLLNG